MKTEEEKRAAMEAMAKKWGHKRPEEHPAASGQDGKAADAANAQRGNGNAAKAQQGNGNAAKAQQGNGNAAKAQRGNGNAAKAQREAGKGGSAGTEGRTAEKMKPNRFENAFMIDLMILRNSLAVKAEKCRGRLETVNPHGWRDLRLLYSLVCRIQEQLLETMPESRRDYYSVLARSGRYHLEIEGPIRQERTVLISDKNLGAILDAVLENYCVTCLKDGKEIDECPIRETLLEVGPPTEIVEGKNVYGCEYRDVPGMLLRGEMVTV